MKSLCIKTNNDTSINYLLNELKNINLQNFSYVSKEFKHYKNVIIHYKGKHPETFYAKLSTLLAFLVTDELEEDLFNEIITQNYFYFNKSERSDILSVCFKQLSEDYYNLFDKKITVLEDIFLNYITTHHSIEIKGFLTFRASKYLDILDQIVSEAVNTFLIEKEYLEFISLLKVYINSQIPIANIVHLIYSSNESILLDENHHIIKTNPDIFSAKYLSDITFSSNDYTLNSLLNLLPKKIYIHFIDKCNIDDFINTLQLIFEDRVFICN